MRDEGGAGWCVIEVKQKWWALAIVWCSRAASGSGFPDVCNCRVLAPSGSFSKRTAQTHSSTTPPTFFTLLG